MAWTLDIKNACIGVALVMAACTRCTPAPAPVPPPPAPVLFDAAPTPVPNADAAPACRSAPTCANACCRLASLHCAVAEPSPGGTSCELLCAAYTAPDVKPGLRWNLVACVSAKACGDCR